MEAAGAGGEIRKEGRLDGMSTMISADTAKRSCILCGRPEVPLLVKFRNLTVGRCPHCQAAMVLAIDAEGEPDADDYSARYEQERHNHKAGLCWDLLRRHTNGLDGVQSVLDIGCGEGEFLDLAKEAGLRTAGMDLSPEAVTIAALRGHQIFRHSATELLFPTRARFDVITMWDLLEHLTHPGRSLKLAYELLAPRGRLFVVTPMMGSIFDRVGLASHRMSLGRFDRLLKMCWTTEHLTRFHAHIHVMQHLVARSVLEVDVLELDGAPKIVERNGAGLGLDRGLQVKHLEHAFT